MWCNGGANGIKENLNSLIDKELRLVLSDPGGARTHDPMIKSHLLYQLSHGVIL